jgi:hypothetical protein
MNGFLNYVVKYLLISLIQQWFQLDFPI